MFNFDFIDLFCGIGGMRIPFEELGGKCVFSSEINKFSIQTYQANFGDTPLGDITKIPLESIPKHDLLLAGFPCQPFSQAGKKQGFNDQRGQMFFYIAQILNYHRPQAFLLENVKGFRNHDQGRTLKMVLYILNKLGYFVYHNILSAKDFNLPQNRQRIYLVGFQKQDKHFCFPKPIGLDQKVGDILEQNVDQKYTVSDKMWEGHQKRKQKHLNKGNGFGYSLVNADTLYTNTISARYWKDGSEILLEQKDKNPRVLTPRECARLQGFPEDFKIVVSDRQAWQQFGNSVPVSVIRAIAGEMIDHLNINNRISNYKIINLESLIAEKIKILYPETIEDQLCISGII